MKKSDTRHPSRNCYKLRDMLTTFAALWWVLFGGVCPLYDQVLQLWRVLNHTLVKAVKFKFIHARCFQITWKVLEETTLFFDHRIRHNYFTNKGPRGFPMADLGNLIEDVWFKKFLGSVTIPRKWNTQDYGNNWSTHHGKGKGASSQANGGFPGDVPMPSVPDPYSMPS